MPRDDDEDASAPLELGPPLPATPRARFITPPREEPPAPAGPFSFGVCGALHTTGELVAHPGASGVVRYVNSGVGYSAPPVSPEWRTVPAEPGRYELPWPGDPAAARTLQSLRADLERAARKGQLTDQEHPLLRELDEVAVALAAVAGQLHLARWGLGLIQPANVLIRDRAGRRDVALVDLGFAWRGSFGSPPWDDSPGRPDWLDSHGPYAWLWDREPARQQFADPANGVFPPAGPEADVRTLGRLLAWLLSGVTSRELPPVGGPDGPPQAWAVVADAVGGRLGSSEQLLARLRATPLSEYFVPLREALSLDPEPGRGRKALPLVVATVALLAAGGGVAFYLADRNKGEVAGSAEVGTPDKVESGPNEAPKDAADATKPAEKGGDPAGFAALAELFDKAAKAKDRAGMFDSLKKLLAAAPAGKQGETAALRTRALDEWVAALTEAVQLASDPTRRFDAADRFAALEAELKQLIEAQPATDPAQREKEQECLTLVSEYARQFGPPR